MTRMPGLWEPFGLRSSPFFQDELHPTSAEHPLSLFVGREGELRRIARRMVSDPHTRTIVEGDPGVGKTSFVNRLKAGAGGLDLVTYDRPVRVNRDMSRTQFVAEVLRMLVRIRSACGLRIDQGEFWPRLVQWLEGGELHGGSLTAFGLGGGLSRSHVAPQAPGDPLYEHLGRALEENLADLGRGVLIHVDNLENLSVTDARDTALLLRDLRDYLMLPGAHWVFVGVTGIEDRVFRVYDQVGGIFPAAEVLGALPPSDIQELLRLRYEHLTVPARRMVPPVRPADGARLYSLYQGDLRNFLRLLGDAADRALGLRGVTPMNEEEIIQQVSGGYRQRIHRLLGDGDMQHLSVLMDAFPGDDPQFRVTDAATILEMTQPAASKLVERLLDKRVIRLTRTEGRSVYYRPVGEVLVGFGVSPAALQVAE